MNSRVAHSKLKVFASMQAQAESSVDRRYGPDSKNYKPYHNAGHITDVRSAVSAISLMAGVSPWKRMLMEHAANYHDYFNGLYKGLDEELSAKAAIRVMRISNIFDKADERFVKNLILGTACSLDGNQIIQKAAGMDEYTQMLADGDLSTLGRPTAKYWPVAKSLHYEAHPSEPLVGKALVKFARDEIEVITTHSYFTPQANELFHHKPENLAFLESIVASGVEPQT